MKHAPNHRDPAADLEAAISRAPIRQLAIARKVAMCASAAEASVLSERDRALAMGWAQGRAEHLVAAGYAERVAAAAAASATAQTGLATAREEARPRVAAEILPAAALARVRVEVLVDEIERLADSFGAAHRAMAAAGATCPPWLRASPQIAELARLTRRVIGGATR